MTPETKRDLVAEGERDYEEWRDQLLADPVRRARYEHALAVSRGGYGAVSPSRKPEDFGALRQAFERGVAEELTNEVASSPASPADATRASEQDGDERGDQ